MGQCRKYFGCQDKLCTKLPGVINSNLYFLAVDVAHYRTQTELCMNLLFSQSTSTHCTNSGTCQTVLYDLSPVDRKSLCTDLTGRYSRTRGMIIVELSFITQNVN